MNLLNKKMASEDSSINKALEYLNKGWSILPCGKDKVPLTEWEQWQKKPPTQAEVEFWFKFHKDPQIGIICGKISGIAVIDVEKEGVGKTPQLPPTFTVRTGGGGYHYYYKWQEGIGNRTRVLPFMDVRGEGGYVVAPFSETTKGKYEVVEDLPLADFPMWVLGTKKAYTDWEEITEGVGKGQRNDTAAILAGKLMRALPPEEWRKTVYPFMKWWNDKCDPPLPDWELKTTFTSIANRASQNNWNEEKSEINFIPYTELLEKSIIELDKTKAEDIVSFGYNWLDEKMTGIFNGEMVLIGGETGTGKTTFATNILYKASKKHKCIIFALEDRLVDYGIKALYFEIGKIRKQHLGINTPNYSWNIYRRNEITDPKYPDYRREAFENLKNGNIYFAEVACQLKIDLLEKLIEEKVNEGFDLFLLDHLGFLNFSREDMTKTEYIEECMKRLTTLLRKLLFKIIIVAHYKKLDGKKPKLDSFKDSAAIPQYANYTIHLWRDRSKGANQYATTFLIPKSRNPNGEGTIEVDFDPMINDYKKVEGWWFGTEQDQPFQQEITSEELFNE